MNTSELEARLAGLLASIKAPFTIHQDLRKLTVNGKVLQDDLDCNAAKAVPDLLFALPTLLQSLSTQRQRIEALEAENERLREVLEPFANIGEFFDLETTGFADEDVLNLIVEDGHLIERIAVGAFRTARQALGEG